jgi:hypothetical protein
VEEPGAVAGIGVAEELFEPVVGLLAVEQRLELSDGLGAAVLGDAEEDDAVDDPLDGKVQRGLVQGVVAQGEVAGQFLAPVFDLFEKRDVEFLPAAALGRLAIAVKLALEDGTLAEGPFDEVPAADLFEVSDILASRRRRLVELFGRDPAVVDRQFFEIGQDRHRKLGAPAIPPQLIGGLPSLLEVDERLLGFQEEFACPADAERVIRRLGLPCHLHAVLVDDIPVLFRVAAGVVHVPPQGPRAAYIGLT